MNGGCSNFISILILPAVEIRTSFSNMQCPTVALLVLAGIFSCVQAAASWELTTTSLERCTILSGSGGIPPTPVPSRGVDQTFVTTVTGSPITTPSIVRVTLSTTVTLTDRTSIEYINTVETVTLPTSTKGVLERSVFATATWPVTVCTNGVKPKVKTVYSGTYKPMSGQVTTVPKVYPTEVVCSGGLTTIWISHPEVTSGVETVTVTPTVRVPGYSKLLSPPSFFL